MGHKKQPGFTRRVIKSIKGVIKGEIKRPDNFL
jgi:hypothetical protein